MPAALRDMHERKTGALIRASAWPARSWPAPIRLCSGPIDAYGAQLGLAFQIVDDILDVEGASADLGKTAGKDAAAGKPTYPSALWPRRVTPARRRVRRQRALHACQTPDSAGQLPAIARWVVGRTQLSKSSAARHPARRTRSGRVARARARADPGRARPRERAARSRRPALRSRTTADVHGRRSRSSLCRPRRPEAGPRAGRIRHRRRGRTALDIGASTGGFTDVLLQRGAACVVALDVGHGQLDWKLRSDPRVIVIERVNARTLTADQLPPESRPVFDIVTIDVSFISLRLHPAGRAAAARSRRGRRRAGEAAVRSWASRSRQGRDRPRRSRARACRRRSDRRRDALGLTRDRPRSNRQSPAWKATASS